MTLKEANTVLFKRYLDKMSNKKFFTPPTHKTGISKDKIINMCKAGIEMEMYDDKASRWLGFIQGVLAMNNIIDIDEEREFSRGLFHKVYDTMGLDTPKTIDI